MSDWDGLRKIVAWLKENGPDDENGDGVNSETADSVITFLDVAEAQSMETPQMFWHGGDAIVLTWKAGTPQGWMITFCDDSFHVHYPRGGKE